MAYYVCDISALRFWRSPRSAERLSLPRCTSLANSQSKISLAREGGETWPDWFGLPVHVMVDSETKRSREAEVRVHLCSSSAGGGSYVRVGKGLCVASPETCFVQASRRLEYVELVKLGFELCGTYRLRDSASGFVEAPGLSTPERLAAGFSSAGPSARIARRILRDVLPGAASPMEAAVAMLICLPLRRGGYGLEAPLLNARPVSALPYICDLYWPRACLAIEYDSKAYHSSDAQLERDSLRRAALEDHGIRTISLTRAQVYDPDEFERVVRIVAVALGRNVRIRNKSWSTARAALRDAVLAGNKNTS